MDRQPLTVRCFALLVVLLVSACGRDGNRPGSPEPVTDAFVSAVQQAAGTTPEDAEPADVDAISVTSPEDREPLNVG